MHQNDINKDLGHYINERKRSKPFWKNVFGKDPRPKNVVQEEIKEDIERAAEHEDIAPDEKKELEHMEERIEEVNKVEEEVEERIEQEHEGLLKKFFKKLNFNNEKSSMEEIEDDDNNEKGEQTPKHIADSEEELKQFLKNMHEWITRLDQETLKEFKKSEDFRLYVKILKKYDLIK
jgi:hypothetical protein